MKEKYAEENEAITMEVTAQTHLEKYADKQKNVEIPLTGPVVDEGGKFGASGGAEANASGDGKGYPEIAAIPHDPYPLPTVDEVLDNPSKLSSPPVNKEKPGGFETYVDIVEIDKGT
ncbi:uncharacterized protein LOC118756378 [Rhagoletis pomonella]|uniref:uncharacterized protein LOC118756378 n=1 Tax=Rhagoletis pomonella TaxID=28610 RepID=UPI001781DD76|nr:uncharacterized protein LOC118756378 [Rhagoletis pomonella]